MLAYATFMTARLQSLFGAFIRMRYRRTWEGQLTTQDPNCGTSCGARSCGPAS